jgi:hypothetical protein
MKPSGHNTFNDSLSAVTRCVQQLMRALLLILMSLAPATGTADDANYTEYRIKTAFLYNFSRFVVWPEAALRDRTEFSLCTLGSTLFEEQLDTLTGKTVHSKTLIVKRFIKPEDIMDCQLVFIGQTDSFDETLWMLKERPVLTISDTAAFTEKGGMIQFKLVDNKIRFRVNVDAARTAGLTISSKLLSLAISVTGSR